METRSAPRRCDEANQDLALIRPNVLAHVLRHADLRGVDSRGWFTGLGLAREGLLDPHVRLSYRQVHTLLARALATFDEPGLGLAIGSSESLGVFGLLGLLMMTAPTFGDAVRLGVAHHEVSGSLLDMDFEPGADGGAALVFWPRFDDPSLQPFLCEEILASCVALARDLAGPRFALRRIELTYAAPAYAELYACALGCEVRFGCTANRALMDARWLAAPLAGYNPLAARQALELCQAQQREARGGPEQEIVVTVERVLRGNLQACLGIGEVARSLNLSERTLRRHLAKAGRSFRDIHDSVRAKCALELLHGSAMPVTGVASALGFSDAREFRRAFKRWMGVPPQVARNDRTSANVDRFAPLNGAQ